MPKIATIVLDDEGTAGLEYALLVSLIGLTLLGGIQVLGGGLHETFSNINETLSIVNLLDGKNPAKSY